MRPMANDPFRVLLYSHDSVGLGHTRRNLALAHALADQLPTRTGRPVTGMLVTGVGHGTSLDLPDGFDVVMLPGVRKTGAGYRPRHVQVPMADLIDIRGRMLKGVVRGFSPDLIIVDRHAYGVDGELRTTLADVRRWNPQTTVVLGLREVLDEPEATDREWERLGDLSEFRSLFDQIWVYGDKQVHDVRTSGEVPAELADLIRYTGYLATGRHWVPEDPPTPVPFVLTMVGGGSDGVPLCRAAAQAPVPAGHQHVVVTGPQMAEADRLSIQAVATGRTTVVDSVPDGLAMIRRASAVVSMAGYNTVCEVMSTSTPALLVPRELPRQEQLIRARSLHAAGAMDLCRESELAPAQLGTWLEGAVRRSQPRDHLDRAGLDGVASIVCQIVTCPHTEPTASLTSTLATAQELSNVAS